METGEYAYEAHTSTVEHAVVVKAERRRRWSDDQKLAIVRESLVPGAVVSEIARRHGIGTGLLYTWRRQLLSSAMSGFVPCEIIADRPRLDVPVADDANMPPATPGSVVVELAGGARLWIQGAADAATLRLVLDVLRQR